MTVAVVTGSAAEHPLSEGQREGHQMPLSKKTRRELEFHKARLGDRFPDEAQHALDEDTRFRALMKECNRMNGLPSDDGLDELDRLDEEGGI